MDLEKLEEAQKDAVQALHDILKIPNKTLTEEAGRPYLLKYNAAAMLLSLDTSPPAPFGFPMRFPVDPDAAPSAA